MTPISDLIAAIVARVIAHRQRQSVVNDTSGSRLDTTESPEGRPLRVQRKRCAGWRMPSNTIYVGRPGPWGNPFVVGKSGGVWTAKVMNRRHAWQLYFSVAWQNPHLIRAARAELRGKNLACWCPLPEPYEHDCCHAAVLLEIANSDDEHPPVPEYPRDRDSIDAWAEPEAGE